MYVAYNNTFLQRIFKSVLKRVITFHAFDILHSESAIIGWDENTQNGQLLRLAEMLSNIANLEREKNGTENQLFLLTLQELTSIWKVT